MDRAAWLHKIAKVVDRLAMPRGRFAHVKRVGGFVSVSATSARRSDTSIAACQLPHPYLLIEMQVSAHKTAP
jgi:hypothetical protein